MSANLDRYLSQQVGLKGGIYTTGLYPHTGDLFAIYGMSDGIVLGSTGNIENFNNVEISAGSIVLGSFSEIYVSGNFILYNK